MVEHVRQQYDSYLSKTENQIEYYKNLIENKYTQRTQHTQVSIRFFVF